MLLQAECNLLSIWFGMRAPAGTGCVCSMTREQRKAINIPQGDNDNRKPPGTARADVMSRKVEDPHWALWAVGFPAEDGCAGGSSWCCQGIQGLLSQLSWQLSVRRDWSAHCRWILFFMLLLLCKSILQSSCWSDFSWDGIVPRASLHLPNSTLLPATLCQLLNSADLSRIQTHWKFLSKSSTPSQAGTLYYCPLKS